MLAIISVENLFIVRGPQGLMFNQDRLDHSIEGQQGEADRATTLDQWRWGGSREPVIGDMVVETRMGGILYDRARPGSRGT
jgi:hypothetical protein